MLNGNLFLTKTYLKCLKQGILLKLFNDWLICGRVDQFLPVSHSWSLNMICMELLSILPNSWNKIIYHTSALFDPRNVGNLMTTVSFHSGNFCLSNRVSWANLWSRTFSFFRLAPILYNPRSIWKGTSYKISIIQTNQLTKPNQPTNQPTNQPQQPTFLTGHFQIFNSSSIFSHPAITGSLDSHSVLERQESLSLLWSHHVMSWILHQIISIKIGSSTSQIQNRTKEPGRLEHKSTKKASSFRVCVRLFLGGALEACVSYAFHLKLVHPDNPL